MKTTASFADIILPVATRYEIEDLGSDEGSGTFVSTFIEEHCIDPVGESLGDFDTVAKIAEKLGLYEEYTMGKTKREVMRIFYESTDMPKLLSFDELVEKQYYVIPCDPDVQKEPAGLYRFYKDPKNNPLTTPTGLLEFSSTKLEKHFPLDAERPPVPQWIESGESHDERLSSERAQLYPLLCVSNHGHWRMHAQGDDITWNREVPTMKVKGWDGYLYEPVWLHTSDAEARGIADGDIVKVYNERGTVLCGAYVSERIMPQSVSIDHGARLDPIIPESSTAAAASTASPPTTTPRKKSPGWSSAAFLCRWRRSPPRRWRAG